MSDEVSICNLALSHVGDDATITSIDPPEGSTQAARAAQFYPIARDALLEGHDWNFNTRRITAAQVTAPSTGWQYAYSKPNLALKVISVLPPSSTDDYSAPLPAATVTLSDGSLASPIAGRTLVQPQPFAIEINSSGEQIVVTNQSEAVLRYTVKVTDPTKFSPLFETTLSWLLASYLAGPIIKGKEGRAFAKECLSQARYWLGLATNSDSIQQELNPQHNVAWMAGR